MAGRVGIGVDRGQPGALGQDAQLLLALEDLLAVGLIAHVELPLYFSIHSLGAWWGAWVAPGQKYMKNGLSGATTLASRMKPIALSVRSSVRW